MDHDVTVTFLDGGTEVFTQLNILRPKYDCHVSAADYVSKILELGITTETVQGDGTVLTRKVNSECLCEVTFIRICN